MLRATSKSVFLDRRSFRRRRLRDAARMLPIVSLILLLLPLLTSGAEGARTSGVLVYLFGLWAVLVLIAAGLSHAVVAPEDAAVRPGRRASARSDPP
jgi:hypothetical protein